MGILWVFIAYLCVLCIYVHLCVLYNLICFHWLSFIIYCFFFISVDEILNRYMTAAKSGQEFTRMGATMALGVLPKFFILGKVDQV